MALVRVNGSIEKGPWGHWSGPMGVLKRVNRVNEGMEKGQVRQGLGFGSDRGVAVGQTGVWLWVVLQGCKLYLAGLQALPCRVVISTLQGCKLYLTGL